MKRLLLVLALGGFVQFGFSQDYGWWNELVVWDGKTPWQEYLDLGSGGLGANALPVPFFHHHKIGKQVIFSNQYQFHLNPDDPTHNWLTSLEVPFAERISVKMWMVPIEYYNTSKSLRNQRKIRQFEAKGWSVGDFYFGTFINIIKENRRTPQVILSANLKTASGNNIEAGRFTDTPAYYFDLTAAKSFKVQENFDCRPYLAAGFYAYQTYFGLHAQNDAFLYGVGNTFTAPKLIWTIEVNGYSGYLNIGDQPVILRTSFTYDISEHIHLAVNAQKGLRDFPYTSIGIEGIYLFSIDTL